MSDWDSVQSETWHRLYEQVSDVLARHGTENAFGDGDYSVNEDNYGWERVQVVVDKLDLFEPDIVNELRRLLQDLPKWEITVAVNRTDKSWPPMGLTIREHEIVDGLQRHLLPEVFRTYRYADSRPGTGYD